MSEQVLVERECRAYITGDLPMARVLAELLDVTREMLSCGEARTHYDRGYDDGYRGGLRHG